jgi:hypothetical protein
MAHETDNPDTFAAFAACYGLTLSAVSIPRRSDGSDWNRDALHFACEIRSGTGATVWTGVYSIGSAWPLAWAKEQHKAGFGPIGSAVRFLASLPNHGSVAAAESLATIRAAFMEAAPLKLSEILESLQMDMPRGEYFPDWCENLGFDSESRKALATYESCVAIETGFRAALGYTALSRFLDIQPE